MCRVVERTCSEEGRLFCRILLARLSPGQIGTLFAGSRVTSFEGVSARSRDAAAWAEVFRDKVRAIRDAGPCPVTKSDG